ncbi:hypothetical protein CKO28_03400 [Rhodovibrio sodomensis]|uniref:Uncharacterized protein n=1 Tax=Rhodovibrio sodomensis TaxID=1088 RepID=A0ABS1DAY3_9PROT|nr:hypothetical protein [Rhodovibrio sodomensis]MBK1667091.1 hypothetical protein [Rhodovibrio sodomensis]
MTDKSRRLTVWISAGVLAAGVALPAMAADNSTSKAGDTAKQSQTRAAETRIPDAKMKSFAEAAEDVQSIAAEYRPKIKAAKQAGKTRSCPSASAARWTAARAASPRADRTDMTISIGVHA